jgi:2-dehydro-3-deoxyglucarate aldolase
MKNTLLKKKLQRNELTIGSWLTIGHPAIAEIISNYSFDWLTIDIEHNLFDPSQIRSLISIIQSKDKAALVRVSKNEEVVIKHVLDAGADGVIVPMVSSKEDAQKAVEFVHYPPFGKRGVGLSRAQNYGEGFDSYKEWLKESVVIVAQIEHIDGIRNLKDIISTPGIDAVIVGPYDLSGSLGFPGEYQRAEVIEALKSLERICMEHNFPMGYHVVPPSSELFSQTKEKGYKFIALCTDFLFLGDGIGRFMKKIER